jgi:predicted ArsR family transcriptional regulator
MIQETSESRSQLQPEHWQARVSYYLQQRAAARAGDIAEWLGVEEEVVRCCLTRFEQGGQVEVLRPLGRRAGALPDMEYYRWRQADDDRFSWQARLYQQRSPSLRELRLSLTEAV